VLGPPPPSPDEIQTEARNYLEKFRERIGKNAPRLGEALKRSILEDTPIFQKVSNDTYDTYNKNYYKQKLLKRLSEVNVYPPDDCDVILYILKFIEDNIDTLSAECEESSGGLTYHLREILKILDKLSACDGNAFYSIVPTALIIEARLKLELTELDHAEELLAAKEDLGL
jgi:hypothetical protein